ncbi:zinc-binding dehydrogenase [Paenirhodobacter sp.]|uniref:zinc-binding dehydrogenase n=1 Tax=Paenirhodobacter sp. TaxID=1965326 RepID=UPI003B5018FD
MVHRAQVKAGEHVLITGASGGVGSAAIQLAKRRGARVTAAAGKNKAEQLRSLGAEQVIPRGDLLADHFRCNPLMLFWMWWAVPDFPN